MVVLVSLALAVVGTIPFVFFGASSSLIAVSVVLFVRGMGIGGVTIPMMTDAYTGMVKQEIAQASFGTRLMQNIGSAFGSAALATVVSLSIQGKVQTIPRMTSIKRNSSAAQFDDCQNSFLLLCISQEIILVHSPVDSYT